MKRHAGIGAKGWTVLLTLLAAGVLGYMGSVAYGIMSSQESLVRVEVPAQEVISLSTAGGYTLFHEFSRTPDSLAEMKPAGVDQLQIRLWSNQSGTDVSLRAAQGASRYVIRRLVGESWFTFEIPAPGEFVLTAEYPEGVNGPPTALTLKRNHREQLLHLFTQGLWILGLTALGALALFSFYLRRRLDSHPVDVEFRA